MERHTLQGANQLGLTVQIDVHPGRGECAVVGNSETPLTLAMSGRPDGRSVATLRFQQPHIRIDLACERAINEAGGGTFPIHDGPSSAMLACVEEP